MQLCPSSRRARTCPPASGALVVFVLLAACSTPTGGSASDPSAPSARSLAAATREWASGASSGTVGERPEPVAGEGPDPSTTTSSDAGPVTPPPAPVVVGEAGEVPLPVNVNGCDRGYGVGGQCVPWNFPPGTDDPCAWLEARGFGPLPVNGPDRHGLDTDGDGVGCGPEDRPATLNGPD